MSSDGEPRAPRTTRGDAFRGREARASLLTRGTFLTSPQLKNVGAPGDASPRPERVIVNSHGRTPAQLGVAGSASLAAEIRRVAVGESVLRPLWRAIGSAR